MITNRQTAIKYDCNMRGEGKVRVEAQSDITRVEISVREGDAAVCSAVSECAAKATEVPFSVPRPKLWSVSHPFLYDIRIVVRYKDGEEEINGKLGVREIGANEKNILLNGKPFYVRGYIRGIKAHDHADNGNLGEKAYYEKNIAQAKKYGFNYIRFHSTIPSETLFNVADERGILVHIELREDVDEYNNLEEMVHDTERLISVEYVKGIVDALYNHPSLAVYCIGNEIKGDKVAETIRQIRKNILQNDRTRLFIDTCAWGANNRKWVDFDVQHMSYYFPYGKHANMFEDTENLLVAGDADGNALIEQGVNSSIARELTFSVPLIAHEVCHYTALRDYAALKEKFEQFGSQKPWWVEEELKMIEAKGLSAQYDTMYKASKLFQYNCHKTAFEAIRRSPLLGGFHFLQFADTDAYENSNGMVDCFDDECFISAAEVLAFNGDRVLLAEIRNDKVYAGTQAHIPVYVSDYAETDGKKATLTYRLEGNGGTVLASGEMRNIKLSARGLHKICALRVDIPRVSSQVSVLTVRLMCDDGSVTENRWKIWIFEHFESEKYKDFCAYESGNAVITDDIPKALDALHDGKNVCLVYRSDFTRHLVHQDVPHPAYAFKATWNRFKPVIWDRGTNYGGLCDEKLLNKYGFSTDWYYGANYAALTEDCDKIILDDFPVQVRSIVSGIDKCVRDRFDAYVKCFNLPELMYDRTLRNFSYLFECGADTGNLLVCGLNLTGLDTDEPSAVAMAHFIKEYLRSPDFAPADRMRMEDFEKYLTACAREPVKERIMTQFWQLDDAPVESAQFWKESREYIDDGTWGKNK